MRHLATRAVLDEFEHNLTSPLRSVLLDTLGLAATIEWHARQFRSCTGIPCELTVHDAAGFDVPEDYATTLFEIYNQALGNIARHARARRVAIALTIMPRQVAMTVSLPLL